MVTRALGACATAAVALALSLTARGAGAESTFRVCMDTALPPWSYIPARLPRFDEDPAAAKPLPPATAAEVRVAQGLDVDVALALAKRLGQELQIVHAGWYEIEKALLAGSCDAIVNAWTPSRRTPSSIVASEPYFAWGLQVAVRKDETRFRTYTDLADRVVGHIDDPALELTLRALAGARLQPFELNRQLFYALRTRKVDAVAHDSTYIAWRIGRGEPFRTLGAPLNKLGYHVAVAKSAGEAATRVLAAMKDLVGAAEMVEIQNRWRREQE